MWHLVRQSGNGRQRTRISRLKTNTSLIKTYTDKTAKAAQDASEPLIKGKANYIGKVIRVSDYGEVWEFFISGEDDGSVSSDTFVRILGVLDTASNIIAGDPFNSGIDIDNLFNIEASIC